MGPKQEPKPGFRLIAAVVETEDGPWFVRLLGAEKTAAKHKAAYGERARLGLRPGSSAGAVAGRVDPVC